MLLRSNRELGFVRSKPRHVRTTPYAARKTFRYDGMTVKAYTKSEARALFKGLVGVPRKARLPIGAEVLS